LEVPGVDPSDMDIQIEDGVLTISGERRQEQTSQANGVHVSERRFGRFVRGLVFVMMAVLERPPSSPPLLPPRSTVQFRLIPYLMQARW
jgi:hypothetical protein